METDYLDLVDWLIENGECTSPRGMGTIEIENVALVLTNPRLALPVGIGRRFSSSILAAESMQWLAGVSDLKQLDSVSRGKFSSYADHPDSLYGAYGPRAWAGLEMVVQVLAEDPDSRRAVVSLWSHLESQVTKDLPCTLNWGFRIRDGKLNMTTSMRSNDVYTGVTYDIPAMTRIQSAVAWALGVEVGEYTHVAYSFHLYDRDIPAIDAMRKGTDEHEQPPMLSDFLDDDLAEAGVRRQQILHPLQRWQYLRDTLALGAVIGSDNLPRSFEWYAQHLRGSERHPVYCDRCHYFLPQDHLMCVTGL